MAQPLLFHQSGPRRWCVSLICHLVGARLVAMVCDQININSIVKEGVLQFTTINNLRNIRMAPRFRTVCAPLPVAAAIKLTQAGGELR
jgi:hypothetical protein